MKISTTIFTPKLDENHQPTGLYSPLRQKTTLEVLQDIKEFLKTIKDHHGQSVFDLCEWIEANPKLDIFPRGQPFASVMYGNECRIIRVFVLDMSTHEVQIVITIKYFAGKDFIYEIVKQLNEALYLGLYVDESNIERA